MGRRAMYQMFWSDSWRRGSWNRQDQDARAETREKKNFSDRGERAFCPVRYVSPVKEKSPEIAMIFAPCESPIESSTEIGRLIPSISKTCRNFKLKKWRSFKGRIYSRSTKSFYPGFIHVAKFNFISKFFELYLYYSNKRGYFIKSLSRANRINFIFLQSCRRYCLI